MNMHGRDNGPILRPPISRGCLAQSTRINKGQQRFHRVREVETSGGLRLGTIARTDGNGLSASQVANNRTLAAARLSEQPYRWDRSFSTQLLDLFFVLCLIC